MSFCVDFNQEGHHVCLAHRTTDILTFKPTLLNHILLFLFQISTEAAPSVRFSFSISCQGLVSDQSGMLKRVRSTPPTPNHTKKLRSKPLSPGNCNGSAWLSPCTTIWARPEEAKVECNTQKAKLHIWLSTTSKPSHILTHYLKSFTADLHLVHANPCRPGVVPIYCIMKISSSPLLTNQINQVRTDLLPNLSQILANADLISAS